MSKILIIVKKELLRILTDKRLCFTTIIMPGLMIFIMYALVGMNNPVSMSPLSGDRKPQIRF